jgi:hypothetical protein
MMMHKPMTMQDRPGGTEKRSDRQLPTGEAAPRSELSELLGPQYEGERREEGERPEEEMEEYAGGYLKARHGKVDAWLVVVIVALIVWGIYYGFTYWGGLGEGLDY